MTEIHLIADDVNTRFECDDCEWEGGCNDIETRISDAQERLDPGSIVPAGTCPECGALAYYTDETAPTWTTQSELRKLRDQLRLLDAYGTAKFGDEWWPGNAQPHLGEVEGKALEKLLGETKS